MNKQLDENFTLDFKKKYAQEEYRKMVMVAEVAEKCTGTHACTVLAQTLVKLKLRVLK